MNDTPYGKVLIRISINDLVYVAIDTGGMGNMYARLVVEKWGIDYREISKTDFILIANEALEMVAS